MFFIKTLKLNFASCYRNPRLISRNTREYTKARTSSFNYKIIELPLMSIDKIKYAKMYTEPNKIQLLSSELEHHL